MDKEQREKQILRTNSPKQLINSLYMPPKQEKQEKLFFIDVETTGTDEKKHGLVQFSGQIEIDGEVKEEIDMDIKPFADDVIDPEALDVIDKKESDFESDDFIDPAVAKAKLVEIMDQYIDRYDSSDKFHFIAYNADFDARFVREFFKKNGDVYFGSWWHYPPIDVMQLVALRYMHQRHKFENYKLMTVCRTLGMEIDESKAHDSYYDIICTAKLFRGMRKMTGYC